MGGDYCFKIGGSPHGGGKDGLRGLQNFSVYVKVVLLTHTGVDEA